MVKLEGQRVHQSDEGRYYVLLVGVTNLVGGQYYW